MQFEFATATRIVLGPGAIAKAGPAVAAMGRKVLIVSGRSGRHTQVLSQIFRSLGLEYHLFRAEREPTVQMAREATSLARQVGVEVVVGIGGGSAIDLAKVVSVMLTNPGDLMDYLEVVGRGRAIERPCVPWVAIPTTAGTGAEVTSNTVLAVPEHDRKVSIRSPLMLARLAIVDPELTCTMPPAVTAYTGLDALTQLIEAFVSTGANPITDGFCREGMTRLARSIRVVYRSGEDLQARTDMAIASLLSGMALSNAGLGLVHGLAGPLGGMIEAPHGAICGRLLPFVMQANVEALVAAEPGSQALDRYHQVGQLLTGRPDADVSDAIHWVLTLCHDLQIPGLSSWGLRQTHLDQVARLGLESSSTKRNPVRLGLDQVMDLLEKAF